MPRLLTCPQGHHWQAAENGTPLSTTAPDVCPHCGASAAAPVVLGGEPEALPPPAVPSDEGATLPPPPATAEAALVRLPGYEILGELGRGGMGVVYQARQEGLNRLVALKMLKTGVLADPTELARFRTEAEAIARLQHPGIVQVFEIGEAGGLPYFSLEYCPGGSLADRLDGTPLPPQQAAETVESLARAVQAAHTAGVVHRDLKPANVLVAADSTLKVSDFGLAKRLDATGHTASEAWMGTPSYMSPEQAGGKAKDAGPATDVYALGAILYELLTGRPPFKAATAMDTMLQVLSVEPVPPSRLQPKLPRDLETVCLKCLEKEPPKRYASAAALAEDLRRFQAHEPIAARPVGALERGWRWCRRNPAVAGLTAGVAALLLAVAVGATAAAIRLGAIAQRERAAADQERNALAAAEAERLRAEAERDAKDQALTRAKGLQLTAQSSAALASNPGLALLFSIEGAQRVPGLLANNALLAALDACREERTLRSEGEVRSVSFSPDGRRILSFTRGGGTISLRDASMGQEILELHGPPNLTSAIFSPGGQQVASFCEGFSRYWSRDGVAHCFTDRVVRLWDATSGKPLPVLRGHRERVVSAGFSPDGRRIVTASWDQSARIWDVASGKELFVLRGHSSSLLSAMFSPDGKQVLTVSSGKISH